ELAAVARDERAAVGREGEREDRRRRRAVRPESHARAFRQRVVRVARGQAWPRDEPESLPRAAIARVLVLVLGLFLELVGLFGRRVVRARDDAQVPELDAALPLEVGR